MKAVLCGTGKIGRGIIAKSIVNAGCDLTMLDVDEKLIGLLRESGSYTVRSLDDTTDYTETVSGFKAFLLGSDEAEEAIVDADIIFVSVGVNNLRALIRTIAPYMVRRVQTGRPPVDMIFCENFVGVSRYILNILESDLGINPLLFKWKIGFAGGSVGVVVPPPENPLHIIKGPYEDIHIEESALITRIRIPHFVPVKDFELCIREKLYIYNMAHALSSYLGWLYGYEYVDQAFEAPEIINTVRTAMDAVACALAKEYGIPAKKVREEAEDIERRIRNKQIRDTVVRIAEDPVRKLGYNDRLTGAYRLTCRFGKPCDAVLKGIAAGFLFAEPSDKSAMEIQDYIKENGISAAVAHYTELTDGSVVARIAGEYETLKSIIRT